MNGRHGGRFRQGSRTGLKSTTTKSSTSKLIEQKMLNDYKYAIGTVHQVGDYNKITTYLILHITKTYEHSSDITDAFENQEPFNIDLSAPRLKISSTVKTENTSPQEMLEIKHKNDQYTRLNMKQNYNCTSSKKVIITRTWGNHTHSYLDNAQQAYSIE